MHEDGDTDCLGGFFRCGTGARSCLGMRCDAAIATLHNSNRHRHQFFDFATERSVGQGGAAQGCKPLVNLGDLFAKARC
jgi:hypothetical protein